MTDRLIRLQVLIFTMLAVLAVIVDAPTVARVPLVLVFALLVPGLAVTRFFPTISGVDRLALASAVSMSLNITVSLALVALGEWSGEPVLAVVAATGLGFAALPLQAPWQKRRDSTERRRNEEIRERRRAQGLAYEQVVSADADERRKGLTALSWLLEDDGRRDEASRLRALSRLEIPPRLPLGKTGATSEKELRSTHVRARAEDPETRRRGLLEVAELLDESGRQDEAATLRDIASNDDIPTP